MPNPGRKYASTTKTAFFPMSTEGVRVVELLQQAFSARLLFTVKPSSDSPTDDELVWNSVCHKTNVFGGPQQYVESFVIDYFQTFISFLPCDCMQCNGRYCYRSSVCPSVRLSVRCLSN